MISQLYVPAMFLASLLSARSSFALVVPRVIKGARPPLPTVVAVAAAATRLYSTTSSEQAADVASMRAGEIKKELESLGISTKSFLEKKELVQALQKARADGVQPKASATTSSSSTKSSTPSTSSSSSSSSSSSTTSEPSKPREERVKEEMEKCQGMKATELKKELEDRGLSTKSFFEKSEFVKALAEARVDGVAAKKKEEEEVVYADAELLTDNASGPRARQNKQSQNQKNQGGGKGGWNPAGPAGAAGGEAAGANPFGGMGGMADMMGGMGGMGGMADMLKNMGGMGGAGGMGGMGDMMGKAQQMMKNPEVMKIMKEAQSNPKVMQAVTECMSNPAAFVKYQNDPESKHLMAKKMKL
jgi:hypothetical protein